jgi:hypothetical protein
MKNRMLIPMLALAATVAGSAGPARAADLAIHAGNWNVTLETTMEGLPVAMPAMKHTMTQCLTAKDAVPQAAGKDQKCVVTQQKIEGNTVSWAVTCDDKSGKVEGTGTITYAGETFDGVQSVKMSGGPGMTIRTVTKMIGRRTGDCAK